MTIAVDLGRKATKQTNKTVKLMGKKLIVILSLKNCLSGHVRGLFMTESLQIQDFVSARAYMICIW